MLLDKMPNISPTKILLIRYIIFTCNVCLFIVANVELQQDHHHYTAMAALSQLDELCKKISNKSITLSSLNIVREKRAQLRKLCDAVNSGNKDLCMSFSQVEPHLNTCIQLQSKFMICRDQISTLVGLCSSISDGMFYYCVIYIKNGKYIFRIMPSLITRSKRKLNLKRDRDRHKKSRNK